MLSERAFHLVMTVCCSMGCQAGHFTLLSMFIRVCLMIHESALALQSVHSSDLCTATGFVDATLAPPCSASSGSSSSDGKGTIISNASHVPGNLKLAVANLGLYQSHIDYDTLSHDAVEIVGLAGCFTRFRDAKLPVPDLLESLVQFILCCEFMVVNLAAPMRGAICARRGRWPACRH